MSTSCQSILILLVLGLVPRSTNAQTVWHVDDDCSAPGAGTKVDPFCAIQDGVDASSDGDTVLVAPGTYTGDGNRDISLFGRTITVKSTEGPNSTILDIEGSPESIHGGFFLVDGETQETVIEGFTITNGYLVGDTGGSGFGGGGGGAAIFIRASSPTIRDCILVNNTAASIGAPFPEDGRGGAVYVDEDSQAILEHCIIANNWAERGGGMHISSYCGVIVRNCLVIGNENDENNFGGGINAGRNTTIINTTVAYNISGGTAGGVTTTMGTTLTNCIIWGNQAAFFGDQVTVSDSLAPLDPVLIEYSNIEGGLSAIAGEDDKFIWGLGNIDADPLFFDPEGGDYHLLHGSPCIDAGNNLVVPQDVDTDLDGGPRFLDDPNTRDTGNPDPDAPKLPIVDMGPYEFDHLDCNNNDTPDATDLADGSSTDCNANDIPDECEIDCNGNDQPDNCDISAGSSGDCNSNEIPDECDIGSGVSQDCNQNAIPDACDLASGASQDCGGEGIPDECPENPGVIITSQPLDQQVAPGELVFFGVGAEGTLLEYQWRKDGVDLIESERLLGTQSTLLLILDVGPADAGAYDCMVADFFGDCALSNPATLTVTDPCPADVNDDGVVGPVDLATLLGAWGPCPDPDACPADLNADATVGPFDLATLLASWGPCP